MNFDQKPAALRGPCSLALGSTRVPAKRWATRTDLIGPLDQARQHLVDNPGAADLRGAAAVAGLSPFHFARLFRETFGVSPHRFIAMQRVEAAQRMLRESDTPVAQIARCMGFRDPASFSRFFRQEVGCSPSEYRRSTN